MHQIAAGMRARNTPSAVHFAALSPNRHRNMQLLQSRTGRLRALQQRGDFT
jgi:hypothetical protein